MYTLYSFSLASLACRVHAVLMVRNNLSNWKHQMLFDVPVLCRETELSASFANICDSLWFSRLALNCSGHADASSCCETTNTPLTLIQIQIPALCMLGQSVVTDIDAVLLLFFLQKLES